MMSLDPHPGPAPSPTAASRAFAQIDTAADIDPAWLDGKRQIGITAGASAPEILVREVIQRLESLGAQAPVEVAGIDEHITFSLPKELRLVTL